MRRPWTVLNLDADWVILLACNTAARGADNAEALRAGTPAARLSAFVWFKERAPGRSIAQLAAKQ
jgi:hypothetical protein